MWSIAFIFKHDNFVSWLTDDGTLSNIVGNPDMAFMTSEMGVALDSASKKFRTAIVTGRFYVFGLLVHLFKPLICCLQDGVSRLFGNLCPIITFISPEAMVTTFMVPPRPNWRRYRTWTMAILRQHWLIGWTKIGKEYVETLVQVAHLLEKRLCASGIKGYEIENNRHAVSVHYRHVELGAQHMVLSIVEEIIEKFQESLRVVDGAKVWEVKNICHLQLCVAYAEFLQDTT